MAHTTMAAFAVSLAVAMVAASFLGDLCFDVCEDTEYRDLACRQGCANEPNSLTACEEQCSQIGSPCRTFCVGNFRLCRQECDQKYTAGNYTCLVTCLQQRFNSSQSLTVN